MVFKAVSGAIMLSLVVSISSRSRHSKIYGLFDIFVQGAFCVGWRLRDQFGDQNGDQVKIFLNDRCQMRKFEVMMFGAGAKWGWGEVYYW